MVALNNVYPYPFLAFPDLIHHLEKQEWMLTVPSH